MKSPVDSQFVHDISQLDSLRRQATKGGEGDESAALRAAAEQFEALFTQMLFKSMRDANEAFESDLIDDRTSKFYEQMADEQMASELSREGSLGLADMIVAQLGQALGDSKPNLEEAARTSAQSLPFDQKATSRGGRKKRLRHSITSRLPRRRRVHRRHNSMSILIHLPRLLIH